MLIVDDGWMSAGALEKDLRTLVLWIFEHHRLALSLFNSQFTVMHMKKKAAPLEARGLDPPFPFLPASLSVFFELTM